MVTSETCKEAQKGGYCVKAICKQEKKADDDESKKKKQKKKKDPNAPKRAEKEEGSKCSEEGNWCFHVLLTE